MNLMTEAEISPEVSVSICQTTLSNIPKDVHLQIQFSFSFWVTVAPVLLIAQGYGLIEGVR
jgi:hypothetical protein